MPITNPRKTATIVDTRRTFFNIERLNNCKKVKFFVYKFSLLMELFDELTDLLSVEVSFMVSVTFWWLLEAAEVAPLGAARLGPESILAERACERVAENLRASLFALASFYLSTNWLVLGLSSHLLKRLHLLADRARRQLRSIDGRQTGELLLSSSSNQSRARKSLSKPPSSSRQTTGRAEWTELTPLNLSQSAWVTLARAGICLAS